MGGGSTQSVSLTDSSQFFFLMTSLRSRPNILLKRYRNIEQTENGEGGFNRDRAKSLGPRLRRRNFVRSNERAVLI